MIRKFIRARFQRWIKAREEARYQKLMALYSEISAFNQDAVCSIKLGAPSGDLDPLMKEIGKKSRRAKRLGKRCARDFARQRRRAVNNHERWLREFRRDFSRAQKRIAERRRRDARTAR